MGKQKLKILELLYEYSGNDINLEEKDWNEAKCLLKIFDSYAIGFAEYIQKYKYIDKKGWFTGSYKVADYKSTKELLQTFKKEKGL